ncbi:Tll0287-like domain-containing protein [Desulfogranum japonicum]|uniref:Tll0287-like domain-containing protein n=1 Tax=Desulfogranum japonicum TaxID=231447 RepID=UPI001376E4A0|nr:DUF3365 domain-containing protein [Desulfogranum japonicum]
MFQIGVLHFYKGSEWQIITLLGEELGRSILEKDLTYRAWNSGYGGVYVPIGEKAKPNPYLNHPHKIVTTSNGQSLTLINPAYMTRQVHQLGMEMFNTPGHLTSLKLIRPENAPTPWEAVALNTFEKGMNFFSEAVEIDNTPYLRVMLPVYTRHSCLACHAEQGYKLGDVRGGISTTVSLGKVSKAIEEGAYNHTVFHLLTYFAGLIALAIFFQQSRKQLAARTAVETEREVLIADLQNALDEIKTLREILPICMHCKKIRDDQGYWSQMEAYLHKHADLKFSHGICPECQRTLYPELNDEETS